MYLLLCKTVDLLSRGRPTFAANKYGPYPYGPEKAVDGNHNGTMKYGIYENFQILIQDSFPGFCYHSIMENNTKWWLVILDSLSVIKLIRIYNRTDIESWLI